MLVLAGVTEIVGLRGGATVYGSGKYGEAGAEPCIVTG